MHALPAGTPDPPLQMGEVGVLVVRSNLLRETCLKNAGGPGYSAAPPGAPGVKDFETAEGVHFAAELIEVGVVEH